MQYGYEAKCATDAPACPPIPNSGAYAGHRQGTAMLGVVLIVLGAAFLFGQFVPGVQWWTLWPVAIVVAGLATMVTPGYVHGWGIERVSDGLGTALLGMVLLGNTTGYVSWGMWLTALSLWPVLLVSAGIGIIGSAAGMSWLRALAPLPIWAALLYAAAFHWTGAPLPFVLPEFAPALFTLEWR